MQVGIGHHPEPAVGIIGRRSVTPEIVRVALAANTHVGTHCEVVCASRVEGYELDWLPPCARSVFWIAQME